GLGPEGFATAIVHQTASVTASRTRELLRTFGERRGQGSGLVEGIAATLDALNQSRVDTLLVHNDPDDTRRAYFGAAEVPVAPDDTSARALGVWDRRSGRLVEGAIRAALGTGATVRFVPAHGAHVPAERLGGLTRF